MTSTPPHIKRMWYYRAETGEAKGPLSKKELRLRYYRGELGTEPLVWREGMAEWLPYRACFGPASVLGAVVGGLTGLRGMGRMNFRRFFSQVFRKHTLAEAKVALYGTESTEPEYLDGNWPTPWLYSRVLLWGLLVAVLLFAGASFTGGLTLPAAIPAAAFVAPFAVLILFTELNLRRDLLFGKTLFLALVITPVLALFTAGELNSIFKGAYWAGVTEEPAKLITALLMAQLFGIRTNRILRGMMLGCAVGMAFAFWETMDYIKEVNDLWEMMETAIGRASNEPFAHALWTAITTGAFCLVQSELEKRAQATRRTVNWSVLCHWRFLRIAIIPVLMHTGHNWICEYGAAFGTFLAAIITIGHLLLYLISWEVALQMVKAGLRQLRGVAVDRPRPTPRPTYPAWYSFRLHGRMKGRTYLLLELALLAMLILFPFVIIKFEKPSLLITIYAAYLLYAFLLSIAATVRRVRDTGHSGWWALLVVPLTWFIVPGIILARKRSAPLPAEGEPPTTAEPPQHAAQPELPQLVAPGVHGEGCIFCPHCNGYGGHTPLHSCSVCGGTGAVPLQAAGNTPTEASLPAAKQLLKLLTPTFKGRLSRRWYWVSTLVFTLFIAAKQALPEGAIADILALPTLWAGVMFVCATVRRLHDVGRPAWWALLLPFSVLVFCTPWAALFFIDSRPGANEWGANPKA